MSLTRLLDEAKKLVRGEQDPRLPWIFSGALWELIDHDGDEHQIVMKVLPDTGIVFMDFGDYHMTAPDRLGALAKLDRLGTARYVMTSPKLGPVDPQGVRLNLELSRKISDLEEVERRRAALEHAEAMKAVLLATKGAPHKVRIWTRDGDVRLYFPGQIGFISFSWDGLPSTLLRGRQTLDLNAMYRGWRQAYNVALKRYRSELAERLARNEERWLAMVEEVRP